jgi:hypothetical protein
MVYLCEDWTKRTWAVVRLYSPCWSKKVSSSSHSLFECRQHAVGPDRRVRPLAYRGGLSGRDSRERHCYRLVVPLPWFGHLASISLRPFAPPALTGFFATMDALTPERPALRILIRDNEHRPVPFRSPCFTHQIFPPFRLQPPVVASGTWFGFGSEPTAQSADCIPSSGPERRLGFPLARRLATTTGRIKFVILRTSSSPPVALHPLSRGRSYFRLRSSNPTSTRTFTLLI